LNSDNDFSGLPNISKGFFEGSKLARTSENSKKGGPYPKQDRIKRRNEVFRLHFEYGYSGVRIAKLMGYDQHTIHSDIRFWYSKLADQWKMVDVGAWVLRQIHRFEIQRTRVIEKLEKQESLHDYVHLERLIYEIDSKIENTISKVPHNHQIVANAIYKKLNEELERHHIPIRFPDPNTLRRVSKKTKEKIDKLIEEDLKSADDWMFSNNVG